MSRRRSLRFWLTERRSSTDNSMEDKNKRRKVSANGAWKSRREILLATIDILLLTGLITAGMVLEEVVDIALKRFDNLPIDFQTKLDVLSEMYVGFIVLCAIKELFLWNLLRGWVLRQIPSSFTDDEEEFREEQDEEERDDTAT